MPLNIIRNKKISILLHDFIAPFYNYIKVWYTIKTESVDNPFDTSKLVLNSKIQVSVFGKLKTDSIGSITLSKNNIKEFSYKTKKTSIKARCINS